MADKFDPYREALVMETVTDWPAEYADTPLEQRRQVEAKLHADAENCASLEYIRTHSGFCRKITPTSEEIESALA